ncbi:pyridoxamine phosphate oxidase family protein [Xylariaceae sp. FL0016]|nr:pyridoxamine phosphate oxidase family protein [Xylariaceae sp. FL0016]
MGAYYETIPESLIPWILAQKILWVSTAPLSADGHVNVSPKGGQSGQYFGVPSTKSFWYMDMTGSGNETISHLLEPGNGRITILFNAFEGPARIMRLWGKGRVLERGSKEFDDMVEREKITTVPATRSIIVVDIHQVGSSCGFSVPFYEFKEYRRTLHEFFEKKEAKYLSGNEKESMDRYWALKNAWSMDGLPGMSRGLEAGKKYSIEPLKKMVGPLAPKNGGYASKTDLHVSYLVIALLTLLMAVLAATHPAFIFFPTQRRMQDLLLQVTSMPGGSPSSAALSN